MMRVRAAILCWLMGTAALADGEPAGVFDDYVLSLSWSPSWCALQGAARGAAQCAPDADHGWILHGLWPQYDDGWPAYCPTSRRPPSRAMTAAMADIMGSGGLARHQWKKHGTCSGLSARAYLAKSRAAYETVRRPSLFHALDRPVRLPAEAVEAAFLRANPGWTAEMLTITCRDGRIQEARLCLSRTLVPVPCGRDAARDCTHDDALLAPIP